MTLRSVLLSVLPGAAGPPRRRRHAGALAAGLVTALLLTACATTGGSEARGADGVALDGASTPSTLTIATSFPIDDLDPLTNGFWGVEFGYVELLMRPERSGEPSPWVLEDLTREDDTAWRLTLREGVEFGSGRPLDAEALVQLLAYVAQENPAFASASAFESATAVGDREVVLTTSEPVPTLPNVLADESNVPVFDVDALEAHVASGAAPAALLEAGLYTGPYTVASLDAQRAELAPFPDHWSGGPALDAVTVRFVPEASSRVQAVQAGEADLGLYMPTEVARTLEGRDDAFYVTGPPFGSTFSLTLRTASTGYDDARVRRAVLSAVDYRALAEDVLDGQADVATSVFPPRLDYAVDTQATDLDLAARLLDEAGWTQGPDGTRTRDGSPLRLRLLAYPQQPDSIRIAEALQSQLREVGVVVEVRQVDDITAAREGEDWDGAIVGASLLSFGGSPVEGIATTLETGGRQNFAGVSDPELDAALAELRTSFDPERRTELLQRLQRRIAEQGHYAATVLRRPGIVTNHAWRDYELPISNLWVSATTAP